MYTEGQNDTYSLLYILVFEIRKCISQMYVQYGAPHRTFANLCDMCIIRSIFQIIKISGRRTKKRTPMNFTGQNCNAM